MEGAGLEIEDKQRGGQGVGKETEWKQKNMENEKEEGQKIEEKESGYRIR
jgi:hypothetical protein